MKTDPGEKPYPCAQCKKIFTSNGHLKQHLSNHTRAKTFILHSMYNSELSKIMKETKTLNYTDMAVHCHIMVVFCHVVAVN